MSGWLDGWERVDNPRSGGGTYDPEGEGYPARIVLHTIEGHGFPNLAEHPYPPHLWYDPQTRKGYQTVPLDRSGFALYQDPYAEFYTNRARALQVELVGMAVEAGDWPESSLLNIAADVIAPLVRWAHDQGWDIDLSDAAIPPPGVVSLSARSDAPQRLAPERWAFGPIGTCSHRHVPMGDDHWDTGLLNLTRIVRYARDILDQHATVTAPVPSTKRRRRPGVDFNKRPGTIRWPGFESECDAYDHPHVPAGFTVAVAGLYPGVPAFNAVAVTHTGAEAAQAVSWGEPGRWPIKSDSMVSVVVPAGVACRVVAA